MATFKNDDPLPEGILIESLIDRTKLTLTEMLTERLTKEVLEPLVKEAVEYSMKDLEVAVKQHIKAQDFTRELVFVLKWKDQNENSYSK